MTALNALFAAALGAGALTVATGAQDSTIELKGQRDANLIEAFGTAENYAQALLETVVNIDTETYGDCADGLTLVGEDYFPLKVADETLSSFAGPGGRAYHEMIRTEGCGAMRMNNVYVFVLADGSNRLLPSFPGRSLASLRTQIQAYNQVSPVASETIVDLFDSCATDGEIPPAIVRDMQLLADPPPTRDKWQEVWTFYQCERVIPLFLHFERGDDGIAIAVEVPEQTEGEAPSAIEGG